MPSVVINITIPMKLSKNTLLKIASLGCTIVGTFILVFCEQSICKWIGAILTILPAALNFYIDPLEWGEF